MWGVSHPSTVLTFIGGVDVGDGSECSGDRGIYFSSYPSSVWFTTAIVARTLNGLGGRLRSFKLGGLIGSCRPNPYGIVGSFESEPIVTICDSGDANDEIDIISMFAQNSQCSTDIDCKGCRPLDLLWVWEPTYFSCFSMFFGYFSVTGGFNGLEFDLSLSSAFSK